MGLAERPSQVMTGWSQPTRCVARQHLRLSDVILHNRVDFDRRLHPVLVAAIAGETSLFCEVIGADRNHVVAGFGPDVGIHCHPDLFRLDPAFVDALATHPKPFGMVMHIVGNHLLADIVTVNFFTHDFCSICSAAELLPFNEVAAKGFDGGDQISGLLMKKQDIER